MASSDKDKWHRRTLDPALKARKQRRDDFVTESGLDVDAVYADDDLSSVGFNHERDLGNPGEYPFTRGVQPTMYRGRLWTMRQYSGYATAEESNSRYRYLLEQGQTGLSVAFDLPTQIGYDSDHPLARGEVGKVGVPICHLEDMETLLEGLPLDRVSTSMTINATASVLLCLYAAVARKRGVPLSSISGTLQNDILKEYIARGTYIYPPKPSMRLVVDVFKYCSEHIPRWNTISVSGYHMREAGATAVQELAFTFANAIEYVQAAVDAGLDVDEFAGRVSFFFVAHNNIFEEAAKFRTARRMWAKLMKERFGAKNPRSMRLRFHTQTAGVTLTAQQPDNNVVRTTLQALAAVLGGTQSLHVNSRDEALSLPSEESVQISLRTQQILAHETGIADVADPLGGSYYVEDLTRRLENGAWEYIHRIDNMGGAVASLEQGFQMREIHQAAFQHQMEVEAGRRTIVGVNKYQSEDAPTGGLLKVDEEAARRQTERLERVRRERDETAAAASLSRLEEVAESDDNTVEAILECVENYCTLGEICDIFRGVFGEQREMVGL